MKNNETLKAPMIFKQLIGVLSNSQLSFLVRMRCCKFGSALNSFLKQKIKIGNQIPILSQLFESLIQKFDFEQFSLL